MNTRPTKQTSRSGIALILVLGFLSMMTLLTIAFSTLMRTERLTASAYVDKTKSDVLLDTALSRALAAIEQTVSGENDFYYMDQIILASPDEGGGGPGMPAFGDWVWDHIPRATWDRPLDHLSSFNWRNPEATGWVSIPGQNARVAYYVVDSSGFIDPHFPMLRERRSGQHPSEIQYPDANLGGGTAYDFPSESEASVFAQSITNQWVRFFGQEELTQAYQQSMEGQDFTMTEPPFFMFPYSYAPREWDTIPIVLDQNNDGQYRYIDTDGQPAEVATSSFPRRPGDWPTSPTPVPNWVEALWFGGEIPFRDRDGEVSDEEMRFPMLWNWEEMMAWPNEPPPMTRVTMIQWDHERPPSTLDGYSRGMVDAFAFYNLGKGLPYRTDHGMTLASRSAFAGHYTGDATEDSEDDDEVDQEGQGVTYWQRLPVTGPGLYMTRMWAEAAVMEPELPEDDDEEEPNPRIFYETHIEFTNVTNAPLQFDTLQFPVLRHQVQYSGDRTSGIPAAQVIQGTFQWYAYNSSGLLASSGTLPFHPSYTSTSPAGWHNRTSASGWTPATWEEAYGSNVIPGWESFILAYEVEIELLRHQPEEVQVRPRWLRWRRNDVAQVTPYRVMPGSTFWRLYFYRLDGRYVPIRVWDRGAGSRPRKFIANDPRRVYTGRRNVSNRLARGTPTSLSGINTSVPWWERYNLATGARMDGTGLIYYPEYANPERSDTYPMLDSLSHIGRQPVNPFPVRHWETIPLVGPEARDVGRYFAMTNEVTERGRININSPYREVLAAGFMRANDDMSGAPWNYEPLSYSRALALADLILSRRPDGGYRNTIDVWRAASRSEWSAALGGGDKFEIEEVIARSMNLFTTRQQIYTVMLASQTMSSAANPQPVSESRAMAVIWRDPFPDDEGRHRVKVLSYRSMDDIEGI